MANNLYLVRSRGFRAYVVSENTEGAWNKFSTWLKEHEYGCYFERDFNSIEIVARSDAYSPKTNTGTSYDDGNRDDLLFL